MQDFLDLDSSHALYSTKSRVAEGMMTRPSNWKFRVSFASAKLSESNSKPWSYNGDIGREAGYGSQEVTEEDEEAVKLDDESNKGPSEKDEDDAGYEGGRTFPFLPSCEEYKGLLEANDDGEANDEEYLGGILEMFRDQRAWRRMGRTLPIASLDNATLVSIESRRRNTHIALSKNMSMPPKKNAAPVSLST